MPWTAFRSMFVSYCLTGTYKLAQQAQRPVRLKPVLFWVRGWWLLGAGVLFDTIPARRDCGHEKGRPAPDSSAGRPIRTAEQRFIYAEGHREKRGRRGTTEEQEKEKERTRGNELRLGEHRLSAGLQCVSDFPLRPLFFSVSSASTIAVPQFIKNNSRETDSPDQVRQLAGFASEQIQPIVV